MINSQLLAFYIFVVYQFFCKEICKETKKRVSLLYGNIETFSIFILLIAYQIKLLIALIVRRNEEQRLKSNLHAGRGTNGQKG